MLSQLLKGVDGMDHYLIFSMIVFLVFFVLVIGYLFILKREQIEECSNIPFTDEDPNKSSTSL